MNPDKGIPAATLDAPGWYKMHRIIWSIDGISPCVTTCAGGNVKPKIYIPDTERENPETATRAAEIVAPDWWKMHRIVWSAGGLSPCITTRADHSPRVVIEVGE